MNSDTLDRLLQTSVLIADGCFVALLSEDGRTLHPAAVRFRDETADRAARPFLTAGPIPAGAGAQAWISADGASAALGPAEIDRRAPGHAALARSLGIGQLVLVPLRLEARPLGVVGFARTGAPTFSDGEQALARALVEHASLSMANARLRESLDRPVGTATVRRDVRETERLEAQARQAQKMEAAGTLAGGIAHEFNNILTAILGNLELARLDVGPGHRAHQRLDEIAAAGRRGADLIRQILTVGRPREASQRVIRLGDVVEEAVGLLRSTIPAGVQLSASVAADTPAVLGDPARIHQMLLNLCTNAWQALPDGAGRITIAGQSAAPGGNDGGPARRWARLEVTDTGPGMTEEVAQRIFDPFFTTKPAGEGSGLGLSVVLGIVNEHGGVIRVKSSPGAGATFEILLPGVEPSSETAPPWTPAAARPRRVLYLDDEPSLVRAIQAMLKSLGHQAVGLSDPAQACAEFRRAPNAFDVVITDHNMPGLSGIEVARVMTALRPDLPVILTSGHVPEPLREQAAGAGVRRILEKPTTMEDLSRAIESVTSGPTER